MTITDRLGDVSMFESHRVTIVSNEYKYHSISLEQLEEFNHVFLIYALLDKRYGQAFCEHFELGNSTILYYLTDRRIVDRWIEDNYLKKNYHD